jgi:hypothetical protein
MERNLIEYAGPVADALDAGLAPWEMPHLPRNVLTGKLYRGMNPLLLNIAACRFGFSSPLWGSRKDWEAVGSKLTEPVTAGTRVWVYEDLVYYPWDWTDEDMAYNWEQTDRSYPPPPFTLGNASEVLPRIVEKVGARLPSGIVGQTGPGGMTDDAGVARALMGWGERRVPTEGGYIYRSTNLLSALRADMGAGFLLGLLGVDPLPPHLGRRPKVDARWAELIRKKPEVLPELCERVTHTLDLLLGKAGVRTPWHFFKVKVTRWCLPRGNHSPSVYAVRADDKVLGEVWKEAGGHWKGGKWGGKQTRSRTLDNFKTKEAALAALLLRKGVDERTPIIDAANVVSVPVSFGPWAGKRVFDFDSAHYLGDEEDGCFFLPEQGAEGKWHAFVIVSTDWGDSVLAIDGPHDHYVDACESGIRLALGWLTPRQIRVADEDIGAIREAARSRSGAP